MISRGQIALIHVAKTRTGMTEHEYRALLSGFGVASSKDLTPGKFDRVMQYFVKMGFVQRKSKKPAVVPSSRDLLRGKVKRILSELKLTDTYVDAMAKHMFRSDSWQFLDAERLHKLVAALNYHRQRHPVGG